MMQYLYENFSFPADQSFTIRSDFFEIKKYSILRSHINFEVALLENCRGRRFVGDNIEDFAGTELVLMGSYLPHVWQFYEAIDPSITPRGIVIHFFPDFLGAQFLEKPEAKQLNELFVKASKGILFSDATMTEATKVMEKMLVEKGLTRMSLMLQLLDILAQSPTFKILSSPYYNAIENSAEAQKIDKVFSFIFKNFKEEISLQDVANIAHLSVAAFCRFFKAHTSRTLIEFVKEVRITHAAKLLLEGKHNVTEVCYKSGYNNISNFNKHFKEIKGLSPRDFLKRYNAEQES